MTLRLPYAVAPLVSTTRAMASSSTMCPLKSVSRVRAGATAVNERSTEAKGTPFPTRLRTQTSTGQASSIMLVASMLTLVKGETGLLERWRVEPSVKLMAAPLTAKAVKSVAVTLTSELLSERARVHPVMSRRSMRSNFWSLRSKQPASSRVVSCR